MRKWIVTSTVLVVGIAAAVWLGSGSEEGGASKATNDAMEFENYENQEAESAHSETERNGTEEAVRQAHEDRNKQVDKEGGASSGSANGESGTAQTEITVLGVDRNKPSGGDESATGSSGNEGAALKPLDPEMERQINGISGNVKLNEVNPLPDAIRTLEPAAVEMNNQPTSNANEQGSGGGQ